MISVGRMSVTEGRGGKGVGAGSRSESSEVGSALAWILCLRNRRVFIGLPSIFLGVRGL